jgi:two-component system nitrogen regulation sensor histidine kinase NtrY
MLGFGAQAQGRRLAEAAPALAPVFARACAAPGGAAQDPLRLVVEGREREIVARVTPKGDAGRAEGWVLTLDDLTELAAAQRMAAWGDVARRIAHEIKNPLTPIQLSADRLKRKFRKLPEAEGAALESYADVIARQAGDIRRMVDAFSQFARMPEPERAPQDVAEVVREAVLLRRAAGGEVAWEFEGPGATALALIDRGLLGQAVGNLLKNAGEAVEARRGAERAQGREPRPGRVRAAVRVEGDHVLVEVADDGVGLPEADRGRLTEPYVTTRAKGTGLGLAIVKKIVEQHGGQLTLTDAVPAADDPPDHPRGALARVALPRLEQKPERTAA